MTARTAEGMRIAAFSAIYTVMRIAICSSTVRSLTNGRLASWTSVGIAAVVGIAAAAFILGTTHASPRYWFDYAWIAAVCAALAVRAVRPGAVQKPQDAGLFAWSMPVMATARAVAVSGLDLAHWDTMWISAWLAFVLAWSLAQQVPERFRRTLQRLSDRRVIADAGNGMAELVSAVDRLTHPRARQSRVAQVKAVAGLAA